MERNLNHKDGLLLRSATAQNNGAVSTKSPITSTSPDFVLQWGHRKRLRCTKVQLKDRESNKDSIKRIDSTGSNPVQRTTTARVDRRVVRSDYNKIPNQQPAFNNKVNGHAGSGYLNLRQRPSSPAQRILRNSDTSSVAMRGGQSNGVRAVASPVRGGVSNSDGKVNGNHHHNQEGNNYNNKNNNNHNENNNGSVSPDSKKGGGGGGGSSSGSDAIPAVWPPRFVIGLSNKEKEEDFWAIKRSKLPHRPKKRAKFIQRTLNLVSPGAWLCDLTLERYEVREKKVSKKRPRGLKAMGTMDSDSE